MRHLSGPEGANMLHTDVQKSSAVGAAGTAPKRGWVFMLRAGKPNRLRIGNTAGQVPDKRANRTSEVLLHCSGDASYEDLEASERTSGPRPTSMQDV
jgi:hypothetical protein